MAERFLCKNVHVRCIDQGVQVGGSTMYRL